MKQTRCQLGYAFGAQEKAMANVNDLDLLNRKIAADLLQSLIDKGQLQLPAVSRPEAVAGDVARAYRALLAGITAAENAA